MSMRSGDGFQFAHVDWAARTGAAKKSAHNNNGNSTRNKSWSAREIADEAERVEGACGHIENPLPPTLLFGVMPHAAVDQAEKWAESQSDTYQKKTKKGIVEIKRGYRADAPIMSNGVISLPRERQDEWPEFRDASVRWLKNHYRDRLLSVVEHLDESHPHLHFYVVPLPGEEFGAVHAGYAASREARGKSRGNHVGTAYKAAMKKWQDEFHSAVAQHFDLARFGPKRARKDREAALADRAQRELEAKQLELDAAEAAHKAAEAQLAETREKLDSGIKTLTKNVAKFKQAQQNLEAEKMQWSGIGAKIGAGLRAISGNSEIEKLKAENAGLGQRIVQAVKAEELRWQPALKEAQDEARYQKMQREDAEKKRIEAEEKLARLQHTLRQSTPGFDVSLSGPR